MIVAHLFLLNVYKGSVAYPGDYVVLLSDVTLSVVGTYAKLLVLYNSRIASFSIYIWLGKLVLGRNREKANHEQYASLDFTK